MSDITNFVTVSIALIGAIVAVLTWFRRWVRKQVAIPVQDTLSELQSSKKSGKEKTTRHLVEDMTAALCSMGNDVTAIKNSSERTETLAVQALTVSNNAFDMAKKALDRVTALENRG